MINGTKLLISSFIIFLMVFIGFALYYLINIGNRHVEEDRRIIITKDKIKWLVIIIAILLALGLFLYKYYILRMLLSVGIFSVLLAFLLNPLLIFLENKKLKRSTALVLIYAMLFLIFIILIIGIIPGIAEQAGNLISRLPIYWNDLMKTMERIETELELDKHGISISNLSYQSLLGNSNLSAPSKWLEVAWNGVSNLPAVLLSIFLVLVFTFAMLVNKTNIYDFLLEVLPEKYKENVIENQTLLVGINLTLGQYLKGKIIMAAFVGITTTIMLFIFDIDFAVLIGLLTFVGDIIPYIGPFMGFLPAVFFALIASPLKAVVVAIIFVILQWVENNIVGPKVLGSHTGMNPLLVFVCIIVGGGMFGIWGMIFGVPMVAVILYIVEYYKDKNKELVK